MININNLKFYLEHGIMTNPAANQNMVSNLPTTVEEIVKLVQNILLHRFWAKHYDVELTDELADQTKVRDFNTRLEILKSQKISNIHQKLKPSQRLIGICRDFSVISAALCREVGIPARARCGFATYFESDKYIDHWVLEYYCKNQKTWIMVDAQLDELQKSKLNIGFNSLNVTNSHFVLAAEAWQMCRAGLLDEQKFGIFEWWGYCYLINNLVLDANSLLKMPMQPWDSWPGYKSKEVELWNNDDYETMDKLALLVKNADNDIQALRSFANNNGIKADLNKVFIPK